MESTGHDLPEVKSAAFEVEGIHTDLVHMSFSNKLFVIVTQFEKFGSLVQVTRTNTPDTVLSLNCFVYDTKVLFGKDEDELHAAARYLAEMIDDNKTMIISLGLKNYDVKAIQTLGAKIKEVTHRSV